MTPENFCYWLRGSTELHPIAQPTAEQWASIREHLALANGPQPLPASGAQARFCEWLSGFADLTGVEQPTPNQWLAIQERLRTVFLKVTQLDPAGPKLDRSIRTLELRHDDALRQRIFDTFNTRPLDSTLMQVTC